MTINKDLTVDEIFAIKQEDLTPGDIYAPTDVDIMLKVNPQQQIEDMDLSPVFFQDNDTSISTLRTQNTACLKTVPATDNHIKLKESIGVKLSTVDHSDYGINKPIKLVPFENNLFLLMQYYGQIKVVNSKMEIIGTIDIPRNAATGVADVTDAEYNPDTRQLVFCAVNTHIVRAFTINEDYSATLDFNFYGKAVNNFLTNNRISNPSAVNYLDNGNILVTSRSSKYDGSCSWGGYAVELNPTDGSVVGPFMMTKGTATYGAGGNNVLHPTLTHVYNGKVYITCSDTGTIYEFDNNVISRVISTPSSIPTTISRCNAIIDGVLINATSGGVIYGQDLDTLDVLWVKYNELGELADNVSNDFNYTHITKISDDLFAYMDYAKGNLILDTKLSDLVVPYTLPLPLEELNGVLEDFSIIKYWNAIGEVNPSKFETKVKISELDKVGEVLIELNRK